MKITLSNYRPFAFTRSAIDTAKKFGKEPHHNCAELALKVARVALACLALPFAFLLDLALWPVAALYQRCWTKTTSTLPKPPTRPLSPAEIVLSNPYPGSAGIPNDANRFLADALRLGLALKKERIPQITQRIRKNPETADWAAVCLLAHYLVARSHSSAKLPPSIFPYSTSASGRTNRIDLLYNEFSQLSPADRSAALLAVLVSFDYSQDPSTPKGRFVYSIAANAADMIQDATFLAHFGRARDNIQTIADSVMNGANHL